MNGTYAMNPTQIRDVIDNWHGVELDDLVTLNSKARLDLKFWMAENMSDRHTILGATVTGEDADRVYFKSEADLELYKAHAEIVQ